VTQIRPQAAKTFQTDPFKDLFALLHKIARIAPRAVRSIGFRARNLLGRARLIRRNVIFPLRNMLLRDRPITVWANGLSYVLAPEGSIPLEMWSGRYFEKRELEFIVGRLQPGMTFVDIGANVGLFSIPAAKKVQHGKVYAFEPATWTFERLTKNAHLNNVRNLVPLRSAVGDYTGEAILQINAPGKDGLNTIGKAAHEDSEVVNTESVPITSLDEFLFENSIAHVDAMKIDVEGAELFVLRGAAKLLGRPDAPLILYESGCLTKGFGYHPVETMWLLEWHGYSFFVIDSRSGRISVPPSGRAYDAMVIAVKPTHPAYADVKESAR
jgi:FkbM family methyltransferase